MLVRSVTIKDTAFQLEYLFNFGIIVVLVKFNPKFLYMFVGINYQIFDSN